MSTRYTKGELKEQKINHRLNVLSEAQNTPLDTVTLVQLPASRIVWAAFDVNVMIQFDLS